MIADQRMDRLDRGDDDRGVGASGGAGKKEGGDCEAEAHREFHLYAPLELRL
jgi:hypothetical protein